jgi:hypothetical protein
MTTYNVYNSYMLTFPDYILKIVYNLTIISLATNMLSNLTSFCLAKTILSMALVELRVV